MTRMALLVALVGAGVATAREPIGIALSKPAPFQVVQRIDVDPSRPAKEPGGHADVSVSFERPKGAAWEYRTIILGGAKGRATDWTPFKDTARVAAGGWYRLEIRGKTGDAITHRGAVEPVGVGEVFVVAGQSYATNCNDERLKPADPRVVAFDAAKGSWAVANDPQPAPDGSDGGSIWPPLGDALAKELGVPIGFANVAVGATSSPQWMPGGELHKRLVKAGTALGHFRAVLWQQGESDVIAKTTTEKYVQNVKAIRAAASGNWGTEPTWLLAKSTLHPTVYTDPDGEGRIRKGIDELAKLPGFRTGPDTDALAGENRGGPKSRRHFSAVGQKRAAEMWFAAIKAHLAEPPGLRERLGEMNLLEPAWASGTVYRESSDWEVVGIVEHGEARRLALAAYEHVKTTKS